MLLDRVGNRLDVHLLGNAVTGVMYTRVDDGATFACSGARLQRTCTGYTARRRSPFPRIHCDVADRRDWNRLAERNAAGAAPGVTLPPLPCTVNSLYVVFQDLHVIAECSDIAPPINDIGIAGTYGATEGTTRRVFYSYINTAGSNGLPPSAEPIQLTIELDGNALASLTLLRADRNTGVIDLDNKCRRSDCTGVTISAPTINTDFGLEIDLRDIVLDGTHLAKVGPDGTLFDDQFVALTGQLKAIDIVFPIDNGLLSPPADCSTAAQKIQFTVNDEMFVYGYCADFGFIPPGTATNASGGLTFVVQIGNSSSDALTVVTDASGAVTRAEMGAVSYNQRFVCTTDCTGITVGAPDAGGNRLVTFSGAVLRGVDADGLPGPERTATGTGRILMPPP